jgi:hypothetical protein
VACSLQDRKFICGMKSNSLLRNIFVWQAAKVTHIVSTFRSALWTITHESLDRFAIRVLTVSSSNVIIDHYFCCGAATQRGSWPPHSWGFLDHTQRRTTVGRTPLHGWSARRRYLYLTTHNTHNRKTSMLPVGSEPTISASELPQTYALDRAATGTGEFKVLITKKLIRTVTFKSCGRRPLACWDRGFESRRGHGYLSVVSVVCCQVEVSATSWSLVQRSPTDCPASLCVI